MDVEGEDGTQVDRNDTVSSPFADTQILLVMLYTDSQTPRDSKHV